MEIELKDLRVGDEILVSSNSRLKYLKVLRPVKERGIHAGYQKMMYKSVYCSARKEEIVNTYTYSNGKTTTWKRNVFVCSPDHNVELYQNLNGKTIWLIKRNSL